MLLAHHSLLAHHCCLLKFIACSFVHCCTSNLIDSEQTDGDGRYMDPKVEQKASEITVFPLNWFFLDAFLHLCKRVCPSVRRSVGPSVRNAFSQKMRDASYSRYRHFFHPYDGCPKSRSSMGLSIDQIVKRRIWVKCAQIFFISPCKFQSICVGFLVIVHLFWDKFEEILT